MVPTSRAMDDAAHTHRPFINLFPHSGQLRISMISCVVKLPSSSSTLTLNIPCLFTAISMPLYSTAWFIGTKSFVPDSQYGHFIELTFHPFVYEFNCRAFTFLFCIKLHVVEAKLLKNTFCHNLQRSTKTVVGNHLFQRIIV